MTKASLLKLLKTAQYPEDVFGNELVKTFREYARMLHPDLHPGDKAVEDGFKRLNDFKQIADTKTEAGTYGDRTAIGKPITLKTKKDVFTITELIAQGDLCQVYGGTDTKGERVAVKVCRSPANNDLVANEATRLKELWSAKGKDTPVMKHIPKLADAFILNQGSVNKQVVVLSRFEGYVSFADVLKAFPKGVPLADAAWMFNRLLGALVAAHQADIVHGAVLPSHVLIHAETHSGALLDWSYAVQAGQKIKAICPDQKTLYPHEVLDKKPATFGTDLYMAAKTFCALVSGDPTGQVVPALPRNILGLMRACWLSNVHRSQDVFELFADFKIALEDNFGKPKFRPFAMPPLVAA
jgi:serine/threonine protein kinase